MTSTVERPADFIVPKAVGISQGIQHWTWAENDGSMHLFQWSRYIGRHSSISLRTCVLLLGLPRYSKPELCCMNGGRDDWMMSIRILNQATKSARFSPNLLARKRFLKLWLTLILPTTTQQDEIGFLNLLLHGEIGTCFSCRYQKQLWIICLHTIWARCFFEKFWLTQKSFLLFSCFPPVLTHQKANLRWGDRMSRMTRLSSFLGPKSGMGVEGGRGEAIWNT